MVEYSESILTDDLVKYINDLPPPIPDSQTKKTEKFDEIPTRRVDVLQPSGSSLISLAYFGSERQQPSPFVLISQYSPPAVLAAGDYQWSLLRFLLLAKPVASSSPHYFDVTISDFDVGSGGPFSSILVNSTRTHCAVYSSLSSVCVIFEIPAIPTPTLITSKALKFSGSINIIKWHPQQEHLIAILDSQNATISLFDISCSTALAVASADSPVIDFEFLDEDVEEIQSKTPFYQSFLCLGHDDSVFISTAFKPSEHRGSCGQKSRSKGIISRQFLQLVPPQTDSRKRPQYTSILIIRCGQPILVFGLLQRHGQLDIFGTDVNLDMPDTAMLLDSLELQLPIGPTPRLSLGSHREVCYDPPVTSWRVCSDVAGPFVFVSTSEELIVVEFPWINQLEVFPSPSALSPPCLVPSNAQLLYSTLDTSPRHSTRDTLLVGFCQFPSALSSLAQTGRLILLRASLLPDNPTSEVNVPEAGWDICDSFECVEIQLRTLLATNGTIEKYTMALKDIWETLDEKPESFQEDAAQLRYPLPSNISSSRYRQMLQSLGLSFKNIGLPSSVFTEMADDGLRRNCHENTFTFKVQEGMAVDSILEKLEIASCKLNQLTDFHDQFGSLRKDIGTVASPSIAQQVADRTSHLKQEATRLSNRINDLLTRNSQVLKQFKSLIGTLVNLVDMARIKMLETSVVPSLLNTDHFMAVALGHAIRENKHVLCREIVSELLKGQPDSLQPVLQAKVGMLFEEFCEVLRQRPALH